MCHHKGCEVCSQPTKPETRYFNGGFSCNAVEVLYAASEEGCTFLGVYQISRFKRTNPLLGVLHCDLILAKA